VAWRTPPQGADRETAQYLASGLSYAPRGGPFAHVDELLLVHGLPRELGERALPFVTVFSGLSGVNVLEAAPEVIAALPNMTDDKLNAVLRQREGLAHDVRSASASLGSAQAAVSIDASKAARIDALIQFENGRRVRSEAVILTVDDGDVPYRVLSWHDGFDDPTGNVRRAVIGQ
jgi:general secretion pathway protein K